MKTIGFFLTGCLDGICLTIPHNDQDPQRTTAVFPCCLYYSIFSVIRYVVIPRFLIIIIKKHAHHMVPPGLREYPVVRRRLPLWENTRSRTFFHRFRIRVSEPAEIWKNGSKLACDRKFTCTKYVQIIRTKLKCWRRITSFYSYTCNLKQIHNFHRWLVGEFGVHQTNVTPNVRQIAFVLPG